MLNSQLFDSLLVHTLSTGIGRNVLDLQEKIVMSRRVSPELPSHMVCNGKVKRAGF